MSTSIKVYNAAGQHVETFRMPNKQELDSGKHPTKNTMVRILNRGGYFLREQLPPAVQRALVRKRREKGFHVKGGSK